MRRSLSRIVRSLAAACLTALAALGQGTPIGFEEAFALAPDRAKALEELIPGSLEHYFYSTLHAQNEGRLGEADELMRAWVDRLGLGGRYQELETRQALLRYADDPAGTYRYLTREFGIRFDHQREIPGAVPNLPTALDPRLVARETFLRQALARGDSAIQGITDSGLESFVGRELSIRQLRELLARLERPDVPGLAQLVVRELKDSRSRGFGSLGVHGKLLIAQLEECLARYPELLADKAFVAAYLVRLAPGADERRDDPAVREAHLERLERFAERLPQAFDSLRAHVLYHRLHHDLAQGRPNHERLLRYLRLPRATSYGDPRILANQARVDLNQDWGTGLEPVRNDEGLVRAYLFHFLTAADSFEVYVGPVRRDVLERIFAEAKILAGVGDMERWYSLLDDPAYYEQLKARVEIEFPVTQRREFGADEAVSIDVDVKNVGTLLIKVFEIDTLGFFDSQTGGTLRPIDASVDLDGLIAHEERTVAYDVPALRRVRRTFDFPRLARPGVYVVDFIGNGLASRAVIKKGELSHVMRVGSAGHVFHVLDDRGEALSDASIRYGGREYTADEYGAIAIPFSTDPGSRQIVLRHGDLGVLDRFQHAAESYTFEARVHIERETLIAGETATLLVRPRLSVAGERISLALLQDVRLNVLWQDLDGVTSTQVVRAFELVSDGQERHEATHRIQVPPRTASIQVSLAAKVESLSTGQDVDLISEVASFPVNGIDLTDEIASALLTRTPAGYAIDVLGKNGEPIVDQALSVAFEHRDFTSTIGVALKSDASGRIALGALDGISAVAVSGSGSGSDRWNLERPRRSGHAHTLHGVAGEPLRVPYEGAARTLDRSVATLLELREGVPAFDRFDRLALSDGFVELRDLEAGDYRFTLDETGETFDVRITRGARYRGWAPAASADHARRLELSDATPLNLVDVAVVEEELVVQTANAGRRARVHVFATRYLPAFDPHLRLALSPLGEPARRTLPAQLAQFESGRAIGDEYRYILERRLAHPYPGNMLARAGLLLNPWALQQSTLDTLGLEGRYGTRYRGPGDTGAPSRPAGSAGTRAETGRGSAFANLDFLPEAAAALVNLTPGADGIVRVPLAELGDGHIVSVVLADDDVTLSRTLVRPEGERRTRDARLLDGLDPERHLTEQRRIEYVEPGASVVLADAANAGAQTFGTLESVFQLFQTRSGNADLDRFAFLLRWPELDPDTKRARYSEFACHEVHVFLRQKDPEFFEAVVRPYLANKHEQTFLDHWLLDHDLAGYLEPKAFSQLNVVERVLLLRGLDQSAARHVREALELLPPDTFALATYFDSVLASGGLAAENDLAAALDAARSEARKVGGRRLRKAPEPSSEALGEMPDELELSELRELGYTGSDADGEVAEETDSSAFFLGRGELDVERRERSRAFFRDVEDTQELAENHYWHLPRAAHTAELIRPNPFWLDFARAVPGDPFLSARFPVATGSLAEMLLALAFLDLPFTAVEPELETEGRSLTLRAGSGLFLARKELAAATEAEGTASILIGQDFFRLAEPYLFEDGRQRDRFVTDEFLRGVPYGCRVVVTNPGSAPIDVELLLQIPHGALPVRGGFTTKGVPVTLGGYQSHSLEYAFYFPVSGDYAHYPVHVGEDGTLLGFAAPVRLRVVDEPSAVDTLSWEHVSQAGSTEELFDFLEAANLGRLSLEKIAWRMGERSVYDRTLEHLRSRHTFVPLLWSYSLKHQDERGAREFLRQREDVLQRCGLALESPLVTVDPREQGTYEFLEYDPLINGRAHRFGDTHRILNAAFAAQYQRFLAMLAYRPRLSAEERLEATYYYSLQDRVPEALAMFASVDHDAVAAQLQVDYLRAYLAFYTGELEDARRIAEERVAHPVARWRARFQDVLAQLDEAQGGSAAGVSDPDSREQQQGALAASEPVLELAVEARRVALTYANLAQCAVSYREMDIELLFSTNPFMKPGSSSFAAIKPNRADRVDLPAGQSTHSFELPAEFRSSNVLVEARAAGLVQRTAYYANNLGLQTLSSYGQIRVRKADSGEALPAAYVKVYVRLADGSVRFHKDGYTDLRGRFDYVSLSGMDGAQVERYAVLVMSANDGSLIRELEPPAR